MTVPHYLVAIDPGQSVGICEGYVDPRSAFLPVQTQFTGGLEELEPFMLDLLRQPDFDGGLTVVCEKFTPRPMSRSFKLNELEPIRIEGALRAWLGYDPVWQPPSYQVLAGGATTAERKKNSDNLIKHFGYWVTGSDVGQPDANDAISATKHAYKWLIRNNHKPTLERLEAFDGIHQV